MDYKLGLMSRALNCSASCSFLSNANLEVIELAQQRQQQEISKIVVPIDGSKNSMEAADYAVKMAQKYGSEVAVVHIVNLDQNLQLLGIYRLSYPDPIKKKVEEARAEAQKWSTEIIRIAEQRRVRIKSDVIDSPMSVVSALVNYADQKRQTSL